MVVREGEVGRALPDLPRLNPDRGRLIGVGLLLVGGLCLFWLPLRGVRLDAMTGYGLISVLPVATLVGAALLTTAFFVTLGLTGPHRGLLATQIVLLAFMLHGLAPALEGAARPVTAWQHAGLIEYIARTGGTDCTLDARFCWPGFFGLVAFLTRAGGINDIEPIMHWASVGLELMYAAAMLLILRAMSIGWRARWFTVWLLVATNWVGQDYFAPQGFSYLLYLLFIGLLLGWFKTEAPRRRLLWLPRLLPPRSGPLTSGERLAGSPGTAERVAVLCLLVLIFMVATVSHQFTPYVMLFAATALVLVGRCSLRTLPVLLGVIIVSFLSFMTAAYWSGKPGDLFAGLGSLTQNVASGIGGRITVGSQELAHIQTTRVLLAVVVLSLAALGLIRRRRSRFDDRVALALLLVPFLTLGLQSYGGEIALRVYFFALPAACILVACLFFPRPGDAGRQARAVVAAGVCGAVLVGGFLFVRFGNEYFEQVRPGEVKAFQAMLRDAPTGKINLVFLPDAKDDEADFPQLPWGLRDWERWDYSPVRAYADPVADLARAKEAMRRAGSYFITTRGEEAYNHYNFGQPAGYATRLRAAMVASADLTPVFRDKDAEVYKLANAPRGRPAAVPPAKPFGIGHTRWTPLGLIAAALLMIILFGYEVTRVIRGGAAVRDRPVPRAALSVVSPLLAVLVFVVLERFDHLGG